MLPNIRKARDIYENGQILAQKLAALKNKEKTLMSFDENLIRDNYVKLNYVMPDNKDYVLLFTTLDQLQQNLGVAITRTDFGLRLS